MPGMPRVMKDKATKIAFKILGKPKELLRDVKPKTKVQKVITADELNKVR